MSALLSIMVITLAILACSQGHTLPGEFGVGSYGNRGRICPPCPGDTRFPGIVHNGNYGNRGNFGNYGSRGNYGNYGRHCPPCPGETRIPISPLNEESRQ